MTDGVEAVAGASATVDARVGDRVEGVATVAISRPEKRNALNATVREELGRVLDAVEESAARVLVLTGDEDAGAFVAGADVSEFRGRDAVEQRRASGLPRIYERVAELPQPVIARVNGHALGGGCELALACDVRIAREDAKVGQPEINLGLIPGGGGTQRLPRLVGEGKAMELVLSGDPIDGTEAARIGLVEDAVPAEGLDERVYGLAASMAEGSALALEFGKRAVRSAADLPLEQGLEHERELFLALFGAGEKDEGIDAFFEDRDPEWSY